VTNFTSCFFVRDVSFHLINNSIMLWLSLHLEFSAIWMDYILNIFLSRYFKNTAIFKLSHKELDIAWNVTKCHEAKNNIWKKVWATSMSFGGFVLNTMFKKTLFLKILLLVTCINQSFGLVNRLNAKYVLIFITFYIEILKSNVGRRTSRT